MAKRAKKRPEPYFYSGEHEAENFDELENEDDDAYNTEQRERLLDDDEMTAAEDGFMRGHEQEPPSKKETRKKAISHDDQTAVELAKADTEED